MERATRAFRSTAFLLLLTLGASGAWAQTGTTSLRGVVTDKTGAVIVGAKVTLSNPTQAFQRDTQTAATGEYEFTALPPGTYSLTIEMAGFRRYLQKDIQLLVNTPSTINAGCFIVLVFFCIQST